MQHCCNLQSARQGMDHALVALICMNGPFESKLRLWHVCSFRVCVASCSTLLWFPITCRSFYILHFVFWFRPMMDFDIYGPWIRFKLGFAWNSILAPHGFQFENCKDLNLEPACFFILRPACTCISTWVPRDQYIGLAPWDQPPVPSHEPLVHGTSPKGPASQKNNCSWGLRY